jgi:hypothetical protein
VLVSGLAVAAIVDSAYKPLNHDTAWYLTATGRWLAGESLYVDVFETNPPMIFGLSAPSVALANALELPVWWVFQAFVMGVAAGSLGLALGALTWPGADRRLVERVRWATLLAGLYAFFGLGRQDFGQRDQLAAILVLPYVLLLGRLAGGSQPLPGVPLAVAIGVLGGMALALKPHFVLPWLALEAWARWRTRPPLTAWLHPLVAVALLGLYRVIVVLATPSYLTEIVPLALRVYGAYDAPLGEIVARLDFALPMLFASLLLVVAPRVEPLRVGGSSKRSRSSASALPTCCSTRGGRISSWPTANSSQWPRSCS